MEFIWSGKAEAAVSLSFDDGFAATYESTVPLLSERGLKATYNIITNRVGLNFDGLVTASWEDWRQSVQLGHEIGSHGGWHVPLSGNFQDVRRFFSNLTSVSNRCAYVGHVLAIKRALKSWKEYIRSISDDVSDVPGFDNLNASRQQIEKMIAGQRAETFAYPAGRYDLAAQRAVAAAGFRSARTLDLGLNKKTNNFLALRALSIGPGTGVDEVSYWLEKARSTAAWLIIVFHLVAEVNPKGYPYFCSLSDMQRILDRIQQRPLWVATQGQVVRKLSAKVWDEPGTSV
jgi:peptidoglycan/xylan/chitin deacetylase (PgdA/CDA1 family)